MPDPTPTPAAIPRPIEDHGVVGNLGTVALVALDGTVDFLCWPRFDSPSIFLALLDPARGGDFTIDPQLDGPRHVQRYLPDTNVLVTRWVSEAGSLEVTDLMPVLAEHEPWLVRRVRVTRGRVAVRVRCRPRFDYARRSADATACDGGVRFDPGDGGPALRLWATVPVTPAGPDATAEFTLAAGEGADLVLGDAGRPAPDPAAVDGWVDRTVGYWREWSSQSNYKGRWREAVSRSALVMKLLTSREHGSILAAATFGLPEADGAGRNWDYRATWLRDASFTVYAFLRLGYKAEAVTFMAWVRARLKAVADAGGHVQIMYGLDGRTDLPEQSLDHLAGYGGARPVRIGNAAHKQLQLDIYGELLDTGYLVNKYAQGIPHDGWDHVVRTVGYVCKNWDQPDAGIWEKRGEPQHFLHSRVMCWVAVDRAIRLAHKRSLPAPTVEWEATRSKIYADVYENFWCHKGGHFTATRGGSSLDASLLQLPLVRFCTATDPRWLSTLDAIGAKLVDDGLVYRYVEDDGLDGREGGFLACSFWYAECLARAGRLWDARQAFERSLTHANHLGLYSEEAGRSGQLLGNFPQVLTHLALISAAYYLDRELAGGPATEWRP